MANRTPITGPQWFMSIEGLEVARWQEFGHTIEREAVDYIGAGEDIVEPLQGAATISATAERGYMNHDLLRMVLGSPNGAPGNTLKSGQDSPNRQQLRTITLEKRLPEGNVTERVTLFGAWFPSHEWSGSSGSEVATESLDIRATGIEVS